MLWPEYFNDFILPNIQVSGMLNYRRQEHLQKIILHFKIILDMRKYCLQLND